MLIFGIETSCDETAVAVLEVKKRSFNLRSNVVSSQIDIHKKYGGIVPEVAAREHIKNILPVINESLIKAKTNLDKIDLIAITTKPGLITSLIVGVETAKTLACVLNKKIIAVDHLDAHLYANFLENKNIKFPAIGLIVSGGHTELILIKNEFSFRKIGQTVDDASGEAFDKVAKILKLGYPGGPIISKYAEKGDAEKFDLPRPMIYDKTFNFSFSGLKTAVLYLDHDQKKKTKRYKQNMTASFQQAVIDVLIYKTLKATKKFKVKTIMLAGGVAANKELRKQMAEKIKIDFPKTDFLIPDFKFCTDNAAMIAIAGYFYAKKNKFTDWKKLKAETD